MFANLKVRMLIIDEIHHLLGGRIEQQRVFLNTLKFLGNDLKIPIVGVGTVDALRAIQTDPQLANRFKPFALPKWTLDEEFRKLLASFECLLPLRLPSQLHRGECARELLRLSEGTIGDLAELLNEAAGEAIRSGHERIDRELLAGLPWIPPSARRQRANEMTQ